MDHAIACGIGVRGYISCVIECPYEGRTDLVVVRDIVSQMLDLGIQKIALGETIGVAQQSDIQKLYEAIDGVL